MTPDTRPSTASRRLLAAAALLLAAAGAESWRRHADKEIPVPGRWQGSPSPAPPSPDQEALGRPAFNRGTAFILDWKGRPYLVATGHQCGRVDSVTLKRQERVLGDAYPRLPFKARTVSVSRRDARDDLAVFAMHSLNYPSRHFKLASRPPREGQPVWVFYMPVDSDGIGTPTWEARLARGTVIRSSNKAVEFRYQDAPADLMSSGAPVLDDAGGVVGVDVGLIRDNTGSYGLATPHSTLLRALETHGLD